MAFFTPAGNKIKIFGMHLTGDIKRIYSEITTAEITAFSNNNIYVYSPPFLAMDNLQKRMIIGDSNG